ncbi:MAG: hypothetical protein EXX96DRAFT_584257 [Benjaminiella poitrasii]|nr:MAG: hypothetical protein EXX96DRAFT_584257 [Benjaminiella poitrasii]
MPSSLFIYLVCCIIFFFSFCPNKSFRPRFTYSATESIRKKELHVFATIFYLFCYSLTVHNLN